MPEKWTTIIKPKSGWFDINLKEVWKYRDLIMLFVKRNFISQYKQTILGPLWALIQPLLTTVVFTVVFGVIAGLPTDGVPNFVFYMCGNIAWGYFAGCLTNTSQTFVGNARIMGKVYFPRLVIPISTILTHLISYAIQIVFFLCIWAVYLLKPDSVIKPNLWILLVPLLIAQMALLALGTGIIISALTTKYRDLAMLVGFGVQLWMYATPVAYSSKMVPERFMSLYMLNPMSSIIEAIRYAFLGTGGISGGYLLISLAVTLLILFIGVVLFSRVEKTFMDTV